MENLTNSSRWDQAGQSPDVGVPPPYSGAESDAAQQQRELSFPSYSLSIGVKYYALLMLHRMNFEPFLDPRGANRYCRVAGTAKNPPKNEPPMGRDPDEDQSPIRRAPDAATAKKEGLPGNVRASRSRHRTRSARNRCCSSPRAQADAAATGGLFLAGFESDLSAGTLALLAGQRVGGEAPLELDEQGICVGVPALAAQPLDRLEP